MVPVKNFSKNQISLPWLSHAVPAPGYSTMTSCMTNTFGLAFNNSMTLYSVSLEYIHPILSFLQLNLKLY